MNNFVYILECNDKTLYTGWTTNIELRIKAHNEGRGAKYTKGRRPVKLVYSEICETKSEALKKENYIKKLTKKNKTKLILNYKSVIDIKENEV